VRHREESPVSGTAVVLIIVVLLVLVVLGIVLSRRRRSTQLQEHFGPEYERSVAATGDRRSAEAELAERRQRREEFDVRDLIRRSVTGSAGRGTRSSAASSTTRGSRCSPRTCSSPRSCALAATRSTTTSTGAPTTSRSTTRGSCSTTARRGRCATRAARSTPSASARPVTSYRSLIDALLGDSDTADTAGDATSAHDTRRTAAEHADARRDNQLDGDATDRVDGTSAGRHALRHDESGAAGPDDNRGPRSPRTEEEHTR
jgi:hypothetical protein